jgi:hypothetical protein
MSKKSILFVAPFVTNNRFDAASKAVISEPALPTPLFARPKNSREIPLEADTAGVFPAGGTITAVVATATARPRREKR